jgi:hypothetical protein
MGKDGALEEKKLGKSVNRAWLGDTDGIIVSIRG